MPAIVLDTTGGQSVAFRTQSLSEFASGSVGHATQAPALGCRCE